MVRSHARTHACTEISRELYIFSVNQPMFLVAAVRLFFSTCLALPSAWSPSPVTYVALCCVSIGFDVMPCRVQCCITLCVVTSCVHCDVLPCVYCVFVLYVVIVCFPQLNPHNLIHCVGCDVLCYLCTRLSAFTRGEIRFMDSMFQ